MKVVTAEEMVRVETLAYKAGFTEQVFMENAGKQIACKVQQMRQHYRLEAPTAFVCGPGNNGGDCFAAACELIEAGYAVTLFALTSLEKLSPLAKFQAKRFLRYGKIASGALDFSSFDLIVDGIFGTGFHGQMQGAFLEAVEKVNSSGKIVLCIDVPSGIHGSKGKVGPAAIIATETLGLGMAKWGCFLPGAWECAGKVSVADFGLPLAFSSQAESSFFLLEEEGIARLLPSVLRERHKYSAGYVVGFGGSEGMEGAPLMASYAALRSGAGIVRLFHPQGVTFGGAPYEVIRGSDADRVQVERALAKASSFFIGPGMGVGPKSAALLHKIMPLIKKACVVDADALTLLAEEKIVFPRGTILTPHQGEMRRLLHQEETIDFSLFLRRCQEYVEEKEVTLVLKGAPTFIFHPQTPAAICGRGDPGMATAGSGDVLTGVIAAFLAQGKEPQEAAILGVFLHGLAGEIAAENFTSYSMVASDIISHLPQAFKLLHASCRKKSGSVMG